MYTQCPVCREAFRVTAEILQQAGGRVRCGACGHVFDALDGLSEAPPSHSRTPGRVEDQRSLRETLEDLGDAGEVRLEDTGVEWRVVDDDDENDASDAGGGAGPSDGSAIRFTLKDAPGERRNDALIPEARGVQEAGRRTQESLELEAPAEERYDDNTPLPGLLDDGEDDAPPLVETPRRAEDFIEPRSREFEERQVDLGFGEPEEWTDLLEEVGEAADPEPSDTEAAAGSGTGFGERAEQDVDTHPDLQALTADEDPTADHPVLEMEALTLVEDEPGDPTPPEIEIPPQTEEEMTINRLIDQDLLKLAETARDLGAARPEASAAASSPPHVETIIMEGEFVRSSLYGDVAIPETIEETPVEEPAAEEGSWLKDTYVRLREGARAELKDPGQRRYPAVAAAALLGLLLAAQLVHAYRESLATFGAFDQTVGALYRGFGVRITPDWDVNGWQFEATTGSTDSSDRMLRISSRIANRSEQTLPYPLLHVSLTDRYEEVIGSELLEPSQYLEIRSVRGKVEPGEKFTATVTIAPLSADATGFKLNVCYPVADAQARCATGAFK